MINLIDIRAALQIKAEITQGLPSHILAFIGWLLDDEVVQREQIAKIHLLSHEMRHPEHVAALGFGAASACLTEEDVALFSEEVAHLRGREFFVPGRPRRFEVDGIALLGVALGIEKYGDPDARDWLASLLMRSSKEVEDDEWLGGLVDAARQCIDEARQRILPADLTLALAAKGKREPQISDLHEGWALATSLKSHGHGTERDTVRLVAFDYIIARQGQIDVNRMTRESLIGLLRSTSRSLRLWTYETEKRTANSKVAKWDIENEYHVQNFLWAILAPVLPDLEDEENLPSIGHKNPRADLGVPSLRTIIEVKFMRRSGQRDYAKTIEEIAADASLYLSKTEDYDNIICFVWDDCAQTEQHDELRSGLEAIKGVSAAVILPRPGKMKKALD